jgi:hypothetical protein
MMNIDIELVILAGVVVSLVALGAALLRNKKPDPKMAFLLALLKDLDANESAHPGSGAGSRISDFFA